MVREALLFSANSDPEESNFRPAPDLRWRGRILWRRGQDPAFEEVPS